MSNKKVTILEKKEEWRFRDLFKVTLTRFRHTLFAGGMSESIPRIVFERADASAVLLYNPEKEQIYLVRQFRYPAYVALENDNDRDIAKAWILELVAGVIEGGHAALDTAKRELLEETGFKVTGDFKSLGTIYVSPGGTSERIHLYLAHVKDLDKVEAGGGLVEEGEDIALETLSLDEAMEMIDTGEINDAKTIIALQKLKLMLLENKA